MRIRILLIILSLAGSLQAQYAPRDNWPGSTAIPADSGIIISWAADYTVNRGFRDIRLPDSGKVVAGLDEYALGPADGQPVSLGDGGNIVLRFFPPVVDGPGYDFAVFENGFHIRINGDSDFLELAFVEVSSDGQNWVRFASESANDTVNQLNTFDGMKASRVHNLAGKYVGKFGTPFDLAELKDSAGIDIMNIGWIRVTDVVGSLNDSLCSRDSRGHKINDPFPTDFDQGGFDLDAIAVIYNQHSPNGVKAVAGNFRPYPNPAYAGQGVQIGTEAIPYRIFDSRGSLVESGMKHLVAKDLPPGIYYLTCGNSRKPLKLILR